MRFIVKTDIVEKMYRLLQDEHNNRLAIKYFEIGETYFPDISFKFELVDVNNHKKKDLVSKPSVKYLSFDKITNNHVFLMDFGHSKEIIKTKITTDFYILPLYFPNNKQEKIAKVVNFGDKKVFLHKN